MKVLQPLILCITSLLISCKHDVQPKLIVGTWTSKTAYDSVTSIHTFEQKGNYFIDDSTNGKRYRKFTNSYRFSEDGKYLIVTLKGGGEPQLEVTKLTNSELQLSIGSYTKKYKRYSKE